LIKTEETDKEELKKELLYFVENRNDHYVFDKYFKDDNGEQVDVTYYQYSAFPPIYEDDEEEYFKNMYKYKLYFMEIHSIEVDDDYKEKIYYLCKQQL
jgi:hypothetical protein